MIPVEVCIDCSDASAALASASAAQNGGASRIECCSAMDVGGLTPDAKVISSLSKSVGEELEILAMIRPRGGDFDYSEAEIAKMIESMSEMASSGAHGVVFGVEKEGELAQEALESLVQAAKMLSLSVTFHRAYDALTAPHQFLDSIIRSGCDRVLTAGVPWGDKRDAVSGVVGLNKTHFTALGRIEVVVGGGVTPSNAGSILSRISPPSALSFHAYSSVRTDGVTDEKKVRALVKSLSR